MKRDPNCQLCPLHQTAEFVCLLGAGPEPCEAMLIGEAPGEREDDSGKPFVGRAGQLLDEMLDTVGLSRKKLFITNAVSCRPPNNRTPRPREIAACRKWVEYQLDIVKPKYVGLLGNVALESVLGLKGIKKLRGRPIEHDGVVYLPMYHPAFILRGDGADRPIAEADLKTFKEIIDFGGIPEERSLNFTIVDTWPKVDQMIDALHGVVSTDIETTCLYPWAPDAHVVMLGFGTASGEFDIPIFHKDSTWSQEDVETIIERITTALDGCINVFQNGKFDCLWMLIHYAVHWENDFDTMLAHYMIDENSYHDLERLAQLYFGAPKWDIPLPEKQGATSLARLAKYHAHDLFYTRKLYFKLKKELEKDPKVYKVFRKLMMPCANLFVEMEAEGMYIDLKKMKEVENYLIDEMAKAEKRLLKWGKINWASSKQVAELLYGKLNIKCLMKTKKGGESTAESALKQINHPCVNDLLIYRGHKQQHSFFIQGWKPYIINSRIHPSFKLHGTVTGRPSAEHPNCLDGDSIILVPNGLKKIKDIKTGDFVYCYDSNLNLSLSRVSWSGKTGVKPVLHILWHTGKKKGSLILTGDHKVRLASGKYIEASRLRSGDNLTSLARRDCNNGYPELKVFNYKGPGVHQGWADEHRILYKLVNGDWPKETHHVDGNRKNNSINNLADIGSRSIHMKHHNKPEEARRRALIAHHRYGSKIIAATIKARKERAERECPTYKVKLAWKKFGNKAHSIKLAAEYLKVSRKTIELRWTLLGYRSYHIRHNHRVLSIKSVGYREVYDITVDKHHNFIANEICVHNCQQVPRDPRIRSMVISPPGYVLCEADLSQIELRIIAELSRVPSMMEAFVNEEDIHWRTAINEIERYVGQTELVISTVKKLNGKTPRFAEAIEVLRKIGPDKAIELDLAWKEIRKKAKAINFGFAYSMGAKKFKLYARDNYDIHLTDRQAQESRIAYFQMYPLENWHNKQQHFAREHGYVRSLTGRKRRLPQAQGLGDTYERAEAWRQAINSPVQGFAAEINLMVLLQLRKEFSREIVRPIITVHDSILFYVRRDWVERVVKRVEEIMQNPSLFKEFNINMDVPICGETKLGPWGSGVSLSKWRLEK